MMNTIDCNSDCVLAEDIFVCNTKLISRYTPINDYIKQSLFSKGINEVSVYKKNDSKDISSNSEADEFKEGYEIAVSDVKKFVLNICDGNSLDYDELLNLSEKVYDNIGKCDYMVKYAREIKNNDEYTFYHSVNVAFYGMLIANWLKLTDNEIREVISAGILHDLGKIKIENEILNKPGKLTNSEYEKIKEHPVYGYEMINNDSRISNKVKLAILQHHERINGTGYPYGIKADEIDLYSKIIAVADVYDAMTSDRVYKKKKSPFIAFKMFRTEGISLFDASILRTFMSNITVHFIGAKVILNDGREGKIVYIPPDNILHPILKVDSNYVDFSKDSDSYISEVIM
ncbi:HD-GYP domain-containing protein [Clostridium pasteurianum]|nr:HD-GYP domain-containing protein [Clostridium pasteurianum]